MQSVVDTDSSEEQQRMKLTKDELEKARRTRRAALERPRRRREPSRGRAPSALGWAGDWPSLATPSAFI
eukprot:6414645-Prymnesium_polylepis.1